MTPLHNFSHLVEMCIKVIIEN